MAQPFLTKQIIIHQPFLQCAAVYSKSFRNLIKASSSGIALLRCMDFHFRTDQCRNDAPRVVRKFFSLCLLYGEPYLPSAPLVPQRNFLFRVKLWVKQPGGEQAAASPYAPCGSMFRLKLV